LLLGLLVVTLADTLAWVWGTARLQREVERALATLRRNGWTVAARPMTRGGWPLALELTVPDLHLTGGGDVVPGGLAWSAPSVTLRLAFADPTTLVIEPAGTELLRLATLPALQVDGQRLRLATALPGSSSPRHIDIAGNGLRIGPAGLQATIALLGGGVDLWSRPNRGEPDFAFSLSGEAIALPPPPGARYALGDRVASAVLQATVTGPFTSNPADPAQSAATWRDGGGIVRVGSFSLGWGPLGVAGRADVHLDQQLQPAGAGHVRIAGGADTLDALAAGHAITANAALAARSLLGLLARTPDSGGQPVLDLPVTLDDRTLSIGPFPLLRVPELHWSS